MIRVCFISEININLGFGRYVAPVIIIVVVILTLGVTLLCLGCLLFFDYLNVIENKSVPRFRLTVTYISDDIIKYETLFYNVFRINHDTSNEYYIVDNLKKHDFSTVPRSPFNRDLSGIDNIIKYKSKYIGDNSNTGNLINSLPLADYGYVFEIDDNKLIVDYHMTDWYLNDDLYVNKALIYNSVSLFALIDNLYSITYNFSGSSYYVNRDDIENNYPNYFKILDDGKIDKNNFNKYVEKVMNDNDFINSNFDKLIKSV